MSFMSIFYVQMLETDLKAEQKRNSLFKYFFPEKLKIAVAKPQKKFDHAKLQTKISRPDKKENVSY